MRQDIYGAIKIQGVILIALIILCITGMNHPSFATTNPATCNHNWQNVVEKDPTDTQDGNLAYSVCSICGLCMTGDDTRTVESCIIPAKKSEGKYFSDDIDSVAFIPISGNPYEMMEEEGLYSFGYVDFETGDKLILNLKNNAGTVTYLFVRNWYTGDYDYFVNEADPADKIAYGNGFEGFYDEHQIAAGATKTLTLKYKGHPFTIELKITPNPVRSVSFQSASSQPMIIPENDTDYGSFEVDEDGINYFEYHVLPYNNGDKLTVNYTDESTKEYTYDINEGRFKNGNEALENVDWRSGQYYFHWYAGDTYYCSIGYSGRYTDDIPIYIKPNYEAGKYRIFPNKIRSDLPIGSSVDIVPEVRTASADAGKEYDVVNDSIAYSWTYDNKDVAITEDKTGSVTKYTVKRNSTNSCSITLNASWGTNTSTQTYYLSEVYCDHDLERIDAVPPTSTSAGNTVYWKCNICGKYFSDDQGENEIDEGVWIIPPSGGAGGNGGSGSSSSSGGGQTIVVPAETGSGSIPVSVTVEGSKASVSAVQASDINNIPKGENLSIDLSGQTGTSKITGTVLPVQMINDLAGSQAGGLTIKMDSVNVIIDKDTLQALAAQAEGNQIELSAVTGLLEPTNSNLTSAQQNSVNNMNKPLVLDASFVSNGKRISDFRGGSVTLEIPYTSSKAVRAWYINEDGTKERLKTIFYNNLAKFRIGHFSIYAIEEYEPEDNPLQITGRPVKVKYSKLKKSKKTVKALIVKKSKGEVTFKKLSVNKKSSCFKVDKNTGKITIKKGTPKGSYKIRIRVYDSGNDDYKAVSLNTTCSIRIK